MLVALSCIGVAAVGCNGAPADLREWRASDHGQEPGALDPDPATPADPVSNARALWAVHCVGCHGREGRGDGAMATMRPPDMTSEAFQQSHSDVQIRTSIVAGKGGAMPSFGAVLRPEAVAQLTALIRAMGAH